MTLIGGSGFKYTQTPTNGQNNSVKKVVTVKNARTDEIAFTLKTDTYKRYNATASKTFFGFDSRYYHIVVYWNQVRWGQIQSDGAVIQGDRTVLKYLDFYPMDVTPITVPILKPVVKPPAVPVVSAVPSIISVPMPSAILREEISWMKTIKNLIQKIKKLIIKILNR